jgi:hypothetical protein
MIDIFVMILLVWSFFGGWKRGFVVTLCHLVGLVLAFLVAPSLAGPIGSIFFSDTIKAYIIGFIIIVAVAIVLVKIFAPMLRAIIVWDPFKRWDALCGAILNVVIAALTLGSLFTIFDQANIGNVPRREAFEELAESGSAEDIMAFADGDIKGLRKYFEPRYVDYEVLESSVTFYPLARFGDIVTPSVSVVKDVFEQSAKSL